MKPRMRSSKKSEIRCLPPHCLSMSRNSHDFNRDLSSRGYSKPSLEYLSSPFLSFVCRRSRPSVRSSMVRQVTSVDDHDSPITITTSLGCQV